ncbi:Pectin methylesterase [Filimonas lacunae]|uniref:Pectinesterase n=1 Tax=Filimonas lacunae TaxID=477680 RepID=A0A173MIQ9_9BACT|nr:pectinesterase family protein [Filimonas lacunae]BAV07347.1 rhamnogalacturonan acetylesterase [Filimonas lacunae]SIS91003.1 Pectin methylesterase [Filimonas lacunae]
MKALPYFCWLWGAMALFSCRKEQAPANLSLNTQMAAVPAGVSITVAQDGSGNYTTVQAAFNAVPSNSSTRTVIYVKNGTYKEVLTVETAKKNITIVGESVTGVKLTYDNYSSKINPATGSGYGTSGSASTFIKGEGFYAQDITFENSSGPVGQALAVNITGDKTIFNNCRFLGRQDTWYGGNCRVYLKNCYIEGTTDFIFGAATAYFDGCSIYSYGGTALTAANTANYVTYGLVFNNCAVTGASGVSTLLGRTWGAYAATAFVNSSLSSIISAAGWNDWGNTANDATARYNEYGNTGSGASTSGRVSWSRVLTSAQAASYTSYLNVLKTTYASSPVIDNWDPYVVINDPAAPPSSPIVSGATYAILAKHSGKGLDVTGVSTSSGAAIQQWNYVGATNQQFVINDVGSGYYNIVNVNSGLCLDVKDGSTSNGGIIQQWGYAGSANQQFTITSTGNGYFKIINKNSGKCLDVKDASTSNGAVVQQYTFANGDNQLWQLSKVN